MTMEIIRTLYAYSRWANQRVLAKTTELTPAQYRASGHASFSSVRDTLVHTIWGQAHWLSRWQTGQSVPVYDPADYDDPETLRRHWQAIDDETDAFIAGLDETTVAQVIHYRNSRNEAESYPLWQVLLHQVNHATQHRSEVAMLLTDYGHSVGWLDMTSFLSSNRDRKVLAQADEEDRQDLPS